MVKYNKPVAEAVELLANSIILASAPVETTACDDTLPPIGDGDVNLN